MKYYFDFDADCGFGAAMTCHKIIEAESWGEAWEKGQNNPIAYGDRGINACFEVPARMQSWPDDDILAFYKDTTFKEQFVTPETIAKNNPCD